MATFLMQQARTSATWAGSTQLGEVKKGQNDIYYITGENIVQVSLLPFLETMMKKSLKVFYMMEPVDEHVVQQLKEFNGKKLKSMMKEGLNFGYEDEKKKKLE
eukprot:16234204-Heterocapsa_arctica.AAC.1